MYARLITSLVAGVCAAIGSAAEPGWLPIAARPLDWVDSLPLLTKQRSALVLDTPLATLVRGFVPALPRRFGLSEAQIRAQVAELMEALSSRDKVDLEIEWLVGSEQPVDFSRSTSQENGIVRSSYKVAGTGITRTMIADDEESAIFIHLIADKPGALSFRVGLSGSNLRIEDRRQLVQPARTPTSPGAHVWVLPFESDVTQAGDSIIVRGEGEALILLTGATGSEATRPLAGTLARLGKRFDPDHNPPDPAKIWHGVLANHLKPAENSP